MLPDSSPHYPVMLKDVIHQISSNPKNIILDSELPTIHSTSLEEQVWYTPTETALTNCADA